MVGYLRKFLIILVFMFSFSSVFAIQANITPINNKITTTGIAYFNISINNDDINDGEFSFDVSPKFPDWSVFSKPQSILTTGFSLDKEENITFELEVSSLTEKSPKYYYLTYQLRDKNSRNILTTGYIPIRITTDSNSSLDYPLVMKTDVNFNSFLIKPTEKLNISIILENKNPRYINETQIRVYSQNGLLDETKNITVGSKTSQSSVSDYMKSVDFSFDFDKYLEPQTDTVFIDVVNEDVVIFSEEYNFAIIPYENQIFEEETTTKLLKYQYDFTLKNDGNYAKDITIKKPINWFVKLFVKAPGAEIFNENQITYLRWDTYLEPGQEVSFGFKVSFWSLFIIIILLGILIFVYLLFESPINIEKRIINKKITKDGSIELKCHIYIKNNEKKVLKNVLIYDFLPSVVSYLKKETLGSMPPNAVIEKGNKGTLLKWKIDLLEAYEERVLVYSVKLKINVVGKIILPGAYAKYIGPFSKLYEIRSNEVDIMLD